MVAVSVILGMLLGFLTGLGIGGGSLLILWLTFGLGMEPGMARGINLLFFLPAAIIACWFRWRQGNIRIRQILPAILCGCAAAGICATLSGTINTELLKKLFGGLLILTGLRELFHKQKSRSG